MSGKFALVPVVLLTALLDFTESLAAKVGVQSTALSTDEATIAQDAEDKAALQAQAAALQAEVDAHANDPDAEPLPDDLAQRITALGVTAQTPTPDSGAS